MQLKKYLSENKISYHKFARMTGVSDNHIRYIALGERTPSRIIAGRIEQASNGHVTRMELLYPEEIISSSEEGGI